MKDLNKGKSSRMKFGIPNGQLIHNLQVQRKTDEL